MKALEQRGGCGAGQGEGRRAARSTGGKGKGSSISQHPEKRGLPSSRSGARPRSRSCTTYLELSTLAKKLPGQTRQQSQPGAKKIWDVAGSQQPSLCRAQPPAVPAGAGEAWRWEVLQAGAVTVTPSSCTLSSSKSFYNSELTRQPFPTNHRGLALRKPRLSRSREGFTKTKPNGFSSSSPAPGLATGTARGTAFTNCPRQLGMLER